MLWLAWFGSALGATLTVCNVGCDATTIQEAVDLAVAGDTVSVSAGTYYENVTITRDLTLLGDGADVTTIDGGFAGNVVYSYGAGTLHIEGFTIRNANISGSSSDGIAGVWYNPLFAAGSATIRNNVIENAGYGIWVWNAGSAASVTIENNLVRSVVWDAMEVGSADVRVVNNTVLWAGRRGYVGSWGAGTHEVRNNLFAYCGWWAVQHWDDEILVEDYNLFYGNNRYPFDLGPGGMDVVEYNGSSYVGEALGVNDVLADPLLPGGVCRELQPDPASPALDAGDPTPAFDDLDGTRNDIGAYGGPLGGAALDDPSDVCVHVELTPDAVAMGDTTSLRLRLANRGSSTADVRVVGRVRRVEGSNRMRAFSRTVAPGAEWEANRLFTLPADLWSAALLCARAFDRTSGARLAEHCALLGPQ